MTGGDEPPAHVDAGEAGGQPRRSAHPTRARGEGRLEDDDEPRPRAVGPEGWRVVEDDARQRERVGLVVAHEDDVRREGDRTRAPEPRPTERAREGLQGIDGRPERQRISGNERREGRSGRGRCRHRGQTTPRARPTFTNAVTARSRCAGVWAALSWTRMRAASLGTTGYEKPTT